MKGLTTKATLIVTTVFCMGINSNAQTDLPKYEFGVNIGFLVYQGDLTPEQFGSFKTQKISLGLHASKILSHSFSLLANFAFGKLKGDDGLYDNPEFRKQRNFNFTSPVTELTGQVVWNITGSNYAEKGFSPYLFAGAGISFLKINRDWSNININYFGGEASEVLVGLGADTVHSLPRIIPVIPVGGGIKYFFKPNWAVNTEASYRIATTDYLDGFSEAANPAKKDNYLGYSVGVIYRTGNKNKLGCPVMKY
jgi:Domain of unknown function (DUF6089)